MKPNNKKSLIVCFGEDFRSFLALALRLLRWQGIVTPVGTIVWEGKQIHIANVSQS